MTEATKSSIRQLLTVGLDEFFYDQAELQSFKESLPNFYFNGLLRSHISLQNDILAPINNWFSLIYFFSTIGLVLTCAFWPLVQFQHKLDIFPQPQWFYVLSISLMATFFNAAICGALAGTFPRYQTRISWIPLFVLCLIIAKVLGVFFTSKERAGAAVSTESDGIASKKQSIQAVARSR